MTAAVSAIVELRTRDRLRRALRRARTYRLFRRDPALRQHFAEELAWVRTEAAELESAGDVGARHRLRLPHERAIGV